MNSLVAMPDPERNQFVPDLAEWTTAPDASS